MSHGHHRSHIRNNRPYVVHPFLRRYCPDSELIINYKEAECVKLFDLLGHSVQIHI